MNGTDADPARTATAGVTPPPLPPTPGVGPDVRSGAQFVPGPDPRRRSPWIAGVLSLMPGLGQIYVGYYRRGVTQFLIFAFLLLMIVNAVGGEGLVPVVAIGLAFFVLYNLIDAMRRASLYNLALSGIQEVEMPQDFEWPAMSGFRGSIFGGSVLVVVGLALFLHTRFDVSLDWIAEWWPLGITVFGAYLVYRAVQDRGARPGGPGASGGPDLGSAAS